MDTIAKFETLDTSYVSLAALLRYLQERKFEGRVHVSLDQYEADVFLYSAEAPSVWETNHATGKGAQGDGAMDRLLVRAQEPGGLITIYEQTRETTEEGHPGAAGSSESPAESPAAEIEATNVPPVEKKIDWDNLLTASGQLIAAVERAVETTGEEFAGLFRAARVEVGDDYPFLDPSLGGFEYANADVRLHQRPSASAYVNGLTECLRRLTNRLAEGKHGPRFRERLAVELAIAARRQPNALADFTTHLDRIAGTRVL